MGKDKQAQTVSPVRERIFSVARELFWQHGIRAVGVDRIAEQAGTNKMSFYRHFPSKDALVVEYLRAHEAEYWQWWDAVMAAHAGNPRAQIEALFVCSATCRAEDGSQAACALGNAAVELRDAPHPAHQLIASHKAELRRRLRALAAAAGAVEPASLGDALLLLLDGGAASRQLFNAADAPLATCRASVHALLDAQLRAGTATA